MAIKVPEEALISLEQRLNEIQFQSIPLGGTIVTATLIELLNGNRAWSIKERITDLLSTINLLIRNSGYNFSGPKLSSELSDQISGKGLMTIISEKTHLFNINYSVWKNSKPEDILCLIKSNRVKQSFREAEKPFTYLLSDLSAIDPVKWKVVFKKIRPQLKTILKNFTSENGLPSYVGRRVFNIVLQQTRYLMGFENFLNEIKPKYVLVEHDRYNWCASLILAANKLKIPTFTMMHGVVNCEFGYTPILSDYLFCWGNRQKNLLENYEGNAKKVLVTGAPQLSDKITAVKQQVRRKVQIPIDKKVVVLATNPVNEKQRHDLVNIFCQTIQTNENLAGYVRLHPSEDIQYYTEYINKYPEIKFDATNDISFDESFALADLVCIYNSAYGIDAIVRSIPIVIINVDSRDLGQAEDLVKYGNLPMVTSTEEFKKETELFFGNPKYREKIKLRAKKYADSYCHSFGESAAKNVITEIQSLLTEKPKSQI